MLGDDEGVSVPTGTLGTRPGGRTVEPTTAPPPRTGPRGIVSGVLAALQALVLSLAVVVLPAVVAFLLSSGTTESGTGWGRSLSVAAGLWLLAHGVPLAAAGSTITLVPLGLTAIALFTCYVSAKRSSHATLAAWVAGTVTYAAATTAVALVTGSAPGALAVWAPLGGLLVAGLGLGGGILARRDAPTLAEVGERLDRVAPAVLRLGARAGLLATALVTAAAALLVLAWVVAGRATSADVVAGLAPGVAGGVVLALAQLAVVPDLVAWALAWLAGPGFAVGEGTAFTTGGTTSGPLPAVPVLGALPGDDWANAVSAAAPLLLVLAGVVAGLFAWRRLDPARVRWSHVAVVLGGVAGTVVVLVGVLQAAASGAVGPGRLEQVGADPLVTALVVAGEVTLGAALVLVLAHLDVRRWWQERSWRPVTGSSADASDRDAPAATADAPAGDGARDSADPADPADPADGPAGPDVRDARSGA